MNCVLHRWTEMCEVGPGRYQCDRCSGDFVRGADSGEYCGDLAMAIEVVDGRVHLNEIGRAVLAQSEAYARVLRLAAAGVPERIFLAARPQGLAGVRGASLEETLEVYRQAFDALAQADQLGDAEGRQAAMAAVRQWEGAEGHLFPRAPLRALWEVHKVRRSADSVVVVAEAGTWSCLLGEQACKLAADAHGGSDWDYEAQPLGQAASPVLSLDNVLAGITADLSQQGIDLVELPWESQGQQLKHLYEAVVRAVESEGLTLVLARGPKGLIDRTLTSLLGAIAPVGLLHPGTGLVLTGRTAPTHAELASLPGGPALYGRLATTMLRVLRREARRGTKTASPAEVSR